MKKIAFIILLIGALGSLLFVLHAGRHAPVLLLVLFAGWVLSPFIALFLVNVIFKLRSVIFPSAVYWLMWLVSVGSLGAYGIAFIRISSTPHTAVYLGVPLIAWLLIGVTIGVGVYRRGRLLK